jgi:predicted transcriptional regulator
MPKNEQMTKTSFRLSVAEKETLDKYALENDLRVSQVIRRAIRQYLELDTPEVEK